jgi:hypothetical protein
MQNIVCLGTMHTFGGQKTTQYEFDQTWPGLLGKWLQDHGVDNYVYNGGESAFSINYFPYKILNFYKEYKPELFIVELPIIDKIDAEISPAITGDYINQKEDYHPIYSRQRVLTKDWSKGEPYIWPNRISISKQEALDHYLSDKSNKDLFKGHITSEFQSFMQDLDIGDHERKNVNFKFERLKNVLDSEKNLALVDKYFYFYSMFMDESDTDMILYLNNVLNIINTCASLGVKLLLLNVNRPNFVKHYLYEETYKTHIDKSELWIEGPTWFMKNYYRVSDGGYFESEDWQHCIDTVIGQKVKETLAWKN